MAYFQKHLFICTNQHKDGTACCADYNTPKIRQQIKARIKQLGRHQQGDIRINIAGCLGRCEQGPVMVIYPQETWYTFVDQEDIDDIIEQDLINNQIVERLRI